MARPFYEPGRYWGKITRQKLGQASTGTPQLVLSFTVLGKVDPADPDGNLLPVMQQYERTIFRSITEKTIEWVGQDLETLGFTGGSYRQFDEDDPECCDLRGNELAFSCNHEAHYKTGEPCEKWSIASDGSGLEVKPLDDQAIRKLDAMFGKQLKKKPATSATIPATVAPVAPKPNGKKASPLKETFKPGDEEGETDVPF